MIEAYSKREEKLDYRTGLICAVIAEVNRNKKKRSKIFKAEDFMPRKKVKKQKPQDQANFLKALTVSMGGQVID